jgi:hypothetical protein
MSHPDQFLSEWRQMGDDAARDPASWEFTARPLRIGADLCWQRYLEVKDELQRCLELKRADPATVDARDWLAELLLLRVAVLLAAHVVESLLKALIVSKSPTAVDSAGVFYTHDLPQLAGLTDVAFGADAELLPPLRKLIEWAGRYPVPKWSSATKRFQYDVKVLTVDGNIGIDGSTIPGVVSEGQWRRVRALIDRLHGELAQRMQGGATPPPPSGPHAS